MKLLRNLATAVLFAAIVLPAASLVTMATTILVASKAEAAVVRSIDVRGNKRVEAQTVRNYVTIKPGKEFGASDVDASVKALYSTGLFADVRIATQGAVLVVVVVENRIVSSVIFQGNKKYKTRDLQPIIETKSRGMLNDVTLEGDVRRIQQYYTRAGRASASVSTQVNELPNGLVNVVFIIDEGERTGIAQIEFLGNEAYSDSRLRGVMQTGKTNFLSWLTKNDVFDQAKLDADLELLRRYYLQHGYADFYVVSSEANFDDAKHRYSITITVNEGPRYRFGNISIDSSIPEIGSDRLKSKLRTKSGDVFDAQKLEKTLEDLTIEIAQSGYAFAQVRPRAERNAQTLTIDIVYLVDEGQRVYIERIDIRGNDRTRDYVIRREFSMSEGDPYNRVMIDAVERRLRNLGFFKQIAITTEPGSSPDRVIVVVLVEEQSTGEFAIGAGYSTTDGMIVELSVTEKNFLGRGQYVRAAIGGGTDTRTFNIAFTEPYFLGRRMPAGFDIYRRTTQDTTNRPYDAVYTGGGLRLGLPITDALTLDLNYKLVQEVVSNTTFAAAYPNATTLTSSLGYALTYSTIDNKLNPSSGMFARVVQDFAGVGGDTQFVRTVGDFRYYREIMSDTDIIGMIRLSGGNVTGIGQPVRIADNFFKGGETIRGFANMGYGPRDTGGTGLPIGGKNYWAATAEVQFPFPVLPPDLGLRAAVFADAGSLWGFDDPLAAIPGAVSSNSIRSSVGASIMWSSPFGLLRADFAQALTKESYDQTQIFRFSAGTQF